MSKGLNQFKGTDFDEVVTRRLANPIKGLAYWGAKDFKYPTNKLGIKGKTRGYVVGDVRDIAIALTS